jgi:hypothetical protein
MPLEPNEILVAKGENAADRSGGAWVVDPYAITDYGRDDAALELMAVFCACVAGKKATMISGMVAELLGGCGREGTAFERIRSMVADGSLDSNLRRSRVGKYGLLTRGLGDLATSGVDLRTCGPDDLELFRGIGMKTSRFFILHSRPGARVAVIDTHVLKYLRAIGTERVPGTIPTGKDYLRLEQVILGEADRLGMTVAEFDLKVWKWFADRNVGVPGFALPLPARPRTRRKAAPSTRRVSSSQAAAAA